MKTLAILAAVGGTAFHLMTGGIFQQNPYGTPSADNEIKVYVLKNCGLSTIRRVELERLGVPLEVIYPEQRWEVLKELEARLIDMEFDFKGRPVIDHLPIAEVNGKLVTEPDTDKVWQELRYY